MASITLRPNEKTVTVSSGEEPALTYIITAFEATPNGTAVVEY